MNWEWILLGLILLFLFLLFLVSTAAEPLLLSDIPVFLTDVEDMSDCSRQP